MLQSSMARAERNVCGMKKGMIETQVLDIGIYIIIFLLVLSCLEHGRSTALPFTDKSEGLSRE